MPETKPPAESTTREIIPKREPREPSALSTEYHKARKQLMLWAGILFIWELVGIDLEKAKEAGGNAGAIIVAIRSPQAIPWALLILVGYFAFKLRIEWGQCNQARRRLRESRMDYYSAFIVASLAGTLYAGQAISHAQLADRLQSIRTPVALLIFLPLTGAIIASFNRCMELWTAWRSKQKIGWLLWVQSVFFVILVLALLTMSGRRLSLNSIWAIMIVLDAAGTILFLVPWLYSLRLRRKSGQHTSSIY